MSLPRSLEVHGIFCISSGRRETKNNRANRPVNYNHYRTIIDGVADPADDPDIHPHEITVDLRQFAGPNVPLHPDDTLILVLGRVAIQPGNITALMDITHAATFGGDPSAYDYDINAPEMRPEYVAVGHVVSAPELLVGNTILAFRMAVGEYVRDELQTFQIMAGFRTANPRWARPPNIHPNTCVKISGQYTFRHPDGTIGIEIDHITANCAPLPAAQGAGNTVNGDAPGPSNPGGPSPKKRKFRSTGATAASTATSSGTAPAPTSSTSSAPPPTSSSAHPPTSSTAPPPTLAFSGNPFDDANAMVIDPPHHLHPANASPQTFTFQPLANSTHLGALLPGVAPASAPFMSHPAASATRVHASVPFNAFNSVGQQALANGVQNGFTYPGPGPAVAPVGSPVLTRGPSTRGHPSAPSPHGTGPGTARPSATHATQNIVHPAAHHSAAVQGQGHLPPLISSAGVASHRSAIPMQPQPSPSNNGNQQPGSIIINDLSAQFTPRQKQKRNADRFNLDGFE